MWRLVYRLKISKSENYLGRVLPSGSGVLQSVNQDRYYHGNRKFMKVRSKHKSRNLFAPVENVHAVRRGERFNRRYTDKYGVRSDKFVPPHKLPAPRWNWDYDLTKKSASTLHGVHSDNVVKFNQDIVDNNPLKDKQWELGTWEPWSKRCGAVGIKLGVQYMWLKNGTCVSSTLIQILDCHVIKYFSKEEYNGRIAAALIGAKNASPFYRGEKYHQFCLDAGVPVKEKCFRFLITENARLKPGTPIYATHFRVGQSVDLLAKSIGYGFAGVMQRWHMKGGPASHGATKWHRRIGSLADRSGRVVKGRRMPGQLGGTYETAYGRRIFRINTRYNVLYVKGRIPGHINTFVKISDTCNKKLQPRNEDEVLKHIGPFPTYQPELVDEELPENIYDDSVFDFDNPSIVLREDS
ncbi:large ribosomal subunit protein uL3m-like [Styela clava]